MDRKALLRQRVAYPADLPDPETVELRVEAARQDHRERVATLGRLLREHDELWSPAAEAPEHGIASWLSRWIGQPRTSSALGSLEARLEAAQRRVSWMTHRIDRVRAEIALLEQETADLAVTLDRARGAARTAAEAIVALQEAEPAPGLEGEAVANLVRLRELERRRFRAVERRLAEMLAVHEDVTRMHRSLLDALRRLQAAAEAELGALDRELGRAASEARNRDLARAVEGVALAEAVHRVDLAAREGAAVLTSSIDRLREEVALLGPVDRHERQAEREVLAALERESVADLVARARAEVARGR